MSALPYVPFLLGVRSFERKRVNMNPEKIRKALERFALQGSAVANRHARQRRAVANGVDSQVKTEQACARARNSLLDATGDSQRDERKERE